MAKKTTAKTTNKSQAIRDVLEKFGDTLTATEIAEKVKEETGLEVTPGLVYQVKPKKEGTTPRAKATTAPATPDVSSALSKATQLVQAVGGFQQAREALVLCSALSGLCGGEQEATSVLDTLEQSAKLL